MVEASFHRRLCSKDTWSGFSARRRVTPGTSVNNAVWLSSRNRLRADSICRLTSIACRKATDCSRDNATLSATLPMKSLNSTCAAGPSNCSSATSRSPSAWMFSVARPPTWSARKSSCTPSPATSFAPSCNRPHPSTMAAIEKFMALHLIVLGSLQLLSATFADAVREHARCWLRTPSVSVPSDFVSRTALANLLQANISGLGKNPITESIRPRAPAAIATLVI